MRASATFLILLFAVIASAQDAPKGPISPEESLKHLVLGDPNLIIEIVAAEPEVIDPVSMQFDEHGRLWVVEMRDYPTGPKSAPPPLGGPEAKPLSRIKLLEDKDGDGQFETAHVFAENLLFATGVQPWDGGVIVTHSGEIVYLKDTDGDHKADVREVWFTGFSETNTQLRANHPTFGPDGWIYVANGLRGGNVIAVKKDWPVKGEGLGVRGQGLEKDQATNVATSPNHPVTLSPSHNADGKKTTNATGVSHDPANPVPVSLTGRDFKFDPLTGRYEAISGNGQYGMTFDAWGNRFVCDNRHPCRHVIFEEDFIRRCPHVAFPAVVNDVIPPDDKNKVFPLTSAWTTSNLHAGTFTASCGVTVYTGDWLPEEFRGNVFVCEPTGNLVQRAVLEPDGVTFKSHRAGGARFQRAKSSALDSEAQPKKQGQVENVPHEEPEVEFLASRDDWFRPVDLQNGPDGALYVVDMYRAVIEHPEWVPDELKNRPDTWLGNDKGRIYRIRPRSPVAPRQEPPNARATSEKQSASTARSADLSRSDRATLVKPLVAIGNLDDCINSTNGWHRVTASRIAHQQQLLSREITLDPRTETASSLVLQSLRLLNLTRPTFLAESLTESGIAGDLAVQRLGEQFEKPWGIKQNLVLGDLIVRGNVFCILRRLAPLQSDETYVALNLYNMIDVAAADPWTRLIFVASFHDNVLPLSSCLFDKQRSLAKCFRDKQHTALSTADVVAFSEMIGELIGARCEANEVAGVILDWATPDSDSSDDVVIAAAGIRGVATALGRRSLTLERLLQSRSVDEQKEFAAFVERAVKFVTSSAEAGDSAAMIETVRFLRHVDSLEAASALKQLAESNFDQTLRLAALESFASSQLPRADVWLIERYSTEPPAIRRAILSALMASKERQLALLGAIADGKIAATEIDPVRAKQLTDAKDEGVREKARQVLAAAAPASRKEVLEAYQPALTLKADPQRGREVFQKNCVTCHRVGDLGVNVAPDISDTRTKKPEQLLLDILDPNRAIDANYFAYAVVTKEGRTESGVITSESSNSITLKQPEGKTLTLLRTDIEELRNTGISLMPVGVEKNINQQQMADLIFWLKNWRYLDGKVPATSLK